MTPDDRTLHDYFRSSAAYRVRIALNLKGLDYRHVGVHLVRGGGEHLGAGYRALNPQALVPTFQDGALSLTQSLAIIEYLDERHPEVPVLPRDIGQRALARQIALTIACDIHPLNNLRVLKRLTGTLGIDDAARQAWIAHWIAIGFEALEQVLAARPAGTEGRFCVGDAPSIADCCLVPQVFNARRFGVDLDPYPRLMGVVAACDELDAFRRAAPANQPDAEG